MFGIFCAGITLGFIAGMLAICAFIYMFETANGAISGADED